MTDIVNLSTDIAESRCGFHTGPETCSYLGIGRVGWVCLKGTSMQYMIDQRREEKTMRAMGNRCSGPPDFTPCTE